MVFKKITTAMIGYDFVCILTSIIALSWVYQCAILFCFIYYIKLVNQCTKASGPPTKNVGFFCQNVYVDISVALYIVCKLQDG